MCIYISASLGDGKVITPSDLCERAVKLYRDGWGNKEQIILEKTQEDLL